MMNGNCRHQKKKGEKKTGNCGQWIGKSRKKLFKFFLTSLLEYNCFTMLCQFLLYNKVNQLYVYIYPHISSLLCLPPTLPIPPLQVDELISSCYVAASHQLTILHLVVCICRCYYHFAPASPSLPCPQVHSLCLLLYSCPATRFISTIFFLRFHIYVLAYGICFSLSDLLHSV